MQFEWDEAKRLANLQKQGVDFIDASEMFTGEMVILSTAGLIMEKKGISA